MLPGTIHQRVTLRNTGDAEIHDIELRTTCNCIELGIESHVGSLGAGESVDIPVMITNSGSSPIAQAIFADARESGAHAGLEVRADMKWPFKHTPHEGRQLNLDLVRESGAGASRWVQIDLELNDAISDIRLEPQVPWMEIRGASTGGRFVGQVRSVPGAPEGEFLVAMNLTYKATSQSGSAVTGLSGTVRSQQRLDPPTVSLGVCRLGETANGKCVFSFSAPISGPIDVHCSDSSMMARITKRSATDLELEISLIAAKPGALRGIVQLSTKGKPVVDVPVSAFVLERDGTR